MNEHTSLVIVSCYNDFSCLAHAPSGTEAKSALKTYALDSSGRLTLLWASDELDSNKILNPAFIRYHPRKNVVYALTESIEVEGKVVSYAVSSVTGKLSKLAESGAKGKSTCYMTIDSRASKALLVNYWDSTVCTMPLRGDGSTEAVSHVCSPLKGKMVAQRRGDHLADRQSEPHAHAVVLDPVFERVAYVPDLGEDCLHQYVYDAESGALAEAGRIEASNLAGGRHGPRYIEFHPRFNIAYLVNELDSTVAVFEFDEAAAERLQAGETGTPTLHLLHTLSTIPAAFPRRMNTCGRIAVDPTGRFVVVSNRGHESLAVFRVESDGTLSRVGWTHTLGRTPRHFQFSDDGRFLIAANQDSNSLSVFSFDLSSGRLELAGGPYETDSPNFVCCYAPHRNRLIHQTPSKARL
jgi:6-phosphogluconolactonase